ncbi:MAG: PilZ domain-containing protein [Deltaproteobacteria bacterium]|nr:PilZ domain-containing protein [Deltaproteobacteria bacterium]
MEDRREANRVESMNPIVLDTFEFVGRAGVTEDLSQLGMRLRTTQELPNGTRVRVRLQAVGQLFEATGTVVRQCPTAANSLFHRRCAVRLDQPLS